MNLLKTKTKTIR